MNKKIFTIVIAFGLTACAFSGTYLQPPETGTSSSEIQGDIEACIAEASIARDLTSEEKAMVSGKETARLFMNGRPVVTPEGKPALHQSILPQSANEATDRYAVCLINRGYKWEQS